MPRIFIVLGFALLLAGAFASTRPSHALEALERIDLRASGSGSSDKNNPSGTSVEPFVPVPAVHRETFRSVVIAGLPHVLSPRFEHIAARLSAICGVRFTPLRWRLDMAEFTTDRDVRADELTGKLGLVMISDVSEDLILAPVDRPSTRQAEARLFLHRLLEATQARPMWQDIGVVTASDDENRRKEVIMIQMRRGGRVIGGQQFGNSPENTAAAKAASALELDAAEVFSNRGPLSDPRVMAALNLRDVDLMRPMLHYKVADFFVEPWVAGADRRDSRMAQELIAWGNEMRSSAQSRGITIAALEGMPVSAISDGPKIGLSFNFSDYLMEQAMMAFAGGRVWFGGGYSSYGGNSGGASRAVPIQNPGYVCLALDDFASVREPEQKTMDALRREAAGIIETMGELEAGASPASPPVAHLKQLRVAALKEKGLVARPRRTAWIDPTAAHLHQDVKDEMAPARKGRRVLVEKTKKVLLDYARTASGDFPEGGLGDWNLRQQYGLENDWSYFQVPPYDEDLLVLRRVTDANLVGRHMLLATIEHCPAELQFSARIDTSTGMVTWITGEPEAEEIIAKRRSEVRSGVEKMVEAIMRSEQSAKAIDIFDPAWQAEQLRLWGTASQYTSVTDFSIQHLLPGFVRVQGDCSDRAGKQSVVLEIETGKTRWETLHPDHLSVAEGDEQEAGRFR